MNMKKIWIIAFISGIIAACTVYFSLIQKPNETEQQEKRELNDIQKETNAQNKADTSILDIQPGKRAVTIPVNEAQGIAGFLKPDYMVDVVVIRLPQNDAGVSARILLQNIRVLATGSITTASASKANQSYQTVTLEVTPSQGASLALALNSGTINLMLRQKGDKDVVSETIISP